MVYLLILTFTANLPNNHKEYLSASVDYLLSPEQCETMVKYMALIPKENMQRKYQREVITDIKYTCTEHYR